MSKSDAMWLVTVASLVGTILNIKRRRACFAVWVCTNATWACYDYALGAYAQSALFVCYVGLALWGLWEWRHEAARPVVSGIEPEEE